MSPDIIMDAIVHRCMRPVRHRVRRGVVANATLIAAVACAVSAATLSPAALHAQAPLDARTTAAIDSIFTAYAHSGSPGCAVGVYRHGVVAFARGYGFANLNHDVPITPQTRFTVGSVSKQFTAASIALLVRAGKLSLDDDVHKYVPELPAYAAPITIRQLVHHTSGLRDFWELVVAAGMRADDGYTVGDIMALAAKQQGLNFTPGAEYRYSNTGYLTLGVMVQRVTGQSLRRFADSAIFAPLGMRETFFLDDHTEIVPGRATAYSPNGTGWRIDVWNNDIVGQGGIVTTLADLQKWDENFYNATLGGRAFVDLLQHTDPLTSGAPNQYAFGLEIESYRGRRLVDHTGSTGGYRAALYRFPDLHTSMAMLCNASTANTTALALRMADVVLRDSLGPVVAARAAAPSPAARAVPAVAPRKTEYASIVGRYVSAELNDSVWEIAVASDSGAIMVTRPRNRPLRAPPSATPRQYGDAASFVLTFDAPVKGRAPGFVLDGSRVSGVHFVRAATP